MNQADIEQRLREDAEVQLMLATVERLDLPDWWICAGVLRSKVWGTDLNAQSDIDIVYFDPSDISEATEKRHERHLCE
ncbi:MAG: nucleotidyltransferase family protein, partial [Exiguobacterium acetylicum]